MKRKLLIVALAMGTVGGFASGLASLRCHRHHRYAHFKKEVTEICAEAVRQAEAPSRDAAIPNIGPQPE